MLARHYTWSWNTRTEVRRRMVRLQNDVPLLGGLYGPSFVRENVRVCCSGIFSASLSPHYQSPSTHVLRHITKVKLCQPGGGLKTASHVPAAQRVIFILEPFECGPVNDSS